MGDIRKGFEGESLSADSSGCCAGLQKLWALEKILTSLYVPKPARYGSFKGTPPSEKLKKDALLPLLPD